MSVDYYPPCPECGGEMGLDAGLNHWICPDCGKHFEVRDTPPDYEEAE